MTPEQILAIKCAYLDLLGSYEAKERMDIQSHDWKSHLETIWQMREMFDCLKDLPAGMIDPVTESE